MTRPLETLANRATKSACAKPAWAAPIEWPEMKMSAVGWAMTSCWMVGSSCCIISWYDQYRPSWTRQSGPQPDSGLYCVMKNTKSSTQPPKETVPRKATTMRFLTES